MSLIVLLCQGAVAYAQENLCPSQGEGPEMRLHVHNYAVALTEETIDDYEQWLTMLANELAIIVSDLADDENFTYLDDLVLETVESPGYLSRGQRRAYFEKNECVLQTVQTVPKNADRDDGSSAIRFLFTSVPGPCFDRKPCLFDSATYIPPEFNEEVLINFATAITLYALSVDAHEHCKPTRSEKLRGRALQRLEAIDFLDPNFRVEMENLRHDLKQPPEPPDECGG